MDILTWGPMIKKHDKSLSDLNEALEIKPDYADAQKNRELMLKRKQ